MRNWGKLVVMFLVVAAFSLTLQANQPVSAVIANIQGETHTLNTMTDLLAASDSTTAPGLVVATRVHLNRVSATVQGLVGTDLDTMSDEEFTLFISSLSDLKSSLRAIRQTAEYSGQTDLVAQADNILGSFHTMVMSLASVNTDRKGGSVILIADDGVEVM